MNKLFEIIYETQTTRKPRTLNADNHYLLLKNGAQHKYRKNNLSRIKKLKFGV